jgi:hypothetical protein
MTLISKSRGRMLAVGTFSALLGAAIGGGAMAYQGHMFNALHDLQAAQDQLNAAVSDKGGHRENALNLVAQAIAEVNAGIQVGSE